MPIYRVVWEAEIEAASPSAAAETAVKAIRSAPGAQNFVVECDDGRTLAINPALPSPPGQRRVLSVVR